jgi:predicted Zn-dependent protease with MMP-like domain
VSKQQSPFERDVDEAWACLDEDDLVGAAAALHSARAAEPDAPEVFELEAGLALAREESESALEAYVRWAEADPDDPRPQIGAAELYFYEFGDPEGAARLVRDVLARGGLEVEEEADAHHLLGAILEAKGDRSGMMREWLAVLRLDAAAAAPKTVMPGEQFERVAEQALDELPAEVLEWLTNVPVLVADRPSEEMVLDGVDPRLLGMFSGVPMPEQSTTNGPPHVDVIHLFQRNLERETTGEEQLAEQIRITVLHETAHFFGYEDDRLEELGLG